MIPVRDNIPTQKTPYINYFLIVANILVYLYMLSLNRRDLTSFIFQYAFVPLEFKFMDLFSSQFIHGGALHLGVNMLFLNIFGDNIEDYLGHLKYLLFYLITGALASLTHYVLNPQSIIPTLGASGAIAGVMGAYILLHPRARVDLVVPLLFFFPFFSVPAFTMIIYWIVYQFLQSFGSLAMESGGIAYFAHIGGFFSGLFLVRVFRR